MCNYQSPNRGLMQLFCGRIPKSATRNRPKAMSVKA